MAMDMYCPKCSLWLPPAAVRCSVCGRTATIHPGTEVLDGSDVYTIEEVLGMGGMGIVYKASHPDHGNVALKEFQDGFDPQGSHATTHRDNERRFEREAEMLSILRRPSAYPECFGQFTFEDRLFVAMEFIEGDDLERALKIQPGRKFDERTTLDLGIQICEALAVMHNHQDSTGKPSPFVHRDIKPANVILRPGGQICILDLGIARTQEQTGKTQGRGGTRAGTFDYAAPEQVMGKPVKQSDIYSLAATLFHLKTGKPFKGKHDERFDELTELPAGWRAVFNQAIALRPEDRHQTVEDLGKDLRQLLTTGTAQPTVPTGSGATTPTSPPGTAGTQAAAQTPTTPASSGTAPQPQPAQPSTQASTAPPTPKWPNLRRAARGVKSGFMLPVRKGRSAALATLRAARRGGAKMKGWNWFWLWLVPFGLSVVGHLYGIAKELNVLAWICPLPAILSMRALILAKRGHLNWGGFWQPFLVKAIASAWLLWWLAYYNNVLF